LSPSASPSASLSPSYSASASASASLSPSASASASPSPSAAADSIVRISFIINPVEMDFTLKEPTMGFNLISGEDYE
jgi:hypothetical protein